MRAMIGGLIAVPVLALFGGAGVLAWRIGMTWDSRNTDSLVASAASICAGGAIVAGVLLALIVGVPLALRAHEGAGLASRAWPERPVVRELPASSSRPPAWAEQPPMLTDNRQQPAAGQWLSGGGEAYDLWDDQPAANDRRGGW